MRVRRTERNRHLYRDYTVFEVGLNLVILTGKILWVLLIFAVTMFDVLENAKTHRVRSFYGS